MDETQTAFAPRMVRVTSGEWVGWWQWDGMDPFEDHAGPFFAREQDGELVCGFRPAAQHLNNSGNVHGGALLTYADFALFTIANAVVPDLHGVTVTMNAEFVGAGRGGALLTARGEVVKAGRSLVFLRGLIDDDGAPVMSFSGTIKLRRVRA